MAQGALYCGGTLHFNMMILLYIMYPVKPFFIADFSESGCISQKEFRDEGVPPPVYPYYLKKPLLS